MLGVATVAKKKTGPKPSAEGPRNALIAIKCRKAYKDWVAEFARTERLTPSQIVDMGLVALAEKRGFRPPPER
jgi:hypothetical protein